MGSPEVRPTLPSGPPPASLRAATRRAYEADRATRAGLLAALAAGLVGASLLAPGDDALRAAVGAVLVTLSFTLPFLGGPAGRAVLPGLVAGTIPFLLPLILHEGSSCSTDCSTTCAVACFVGGAAAGAVVGRQGAGGAVGALSGGGIALLVGALGCACLGMGGIAGMAAGLISIAVPARLLWAGPTAT